ncbi:hypothetical protein BCR42DRAFT_386390 [Absidia repens]|uniref:Uncharacterized protein n=1 Tax=Absidia repens TaxID=90262 RepID=A0A1X2J1P7_9FUNG|nr:hypothetical protein BCR42DRAFT_386390 [Absidia repens]
MTLQSLPFHFLTLMFFQNYILCDKLVLKYTDFEPLIFSHVYIISTSFNAIQLTVTCRKWIYGHQCILKNDDGILRWAHDESIELKPVATPDDGLTDLTTRATVIVWITVLQLIKGLHLIRALMMQYTDLAIGLLSFMAHIYYISKYLGWLHKRLDKDGDCDSGLVY